MKPTHKCSEAHLLEFFFTSATVVFVVFSEYNGSLKCFSVVSEAAFDLKIKLQTASSIVFFFSCFSKNYQCKRRNDCFQALSTV